MLRIILFTFNNGKLRFVFKLKKLLPVNNKSKKCLKQSDPISLDLPKNIRNRQITNPKTFFVLKSALNVHFPRNLFRFIDVDLLTHTSSVKIFATFVCRTEISLIIYY